MGAVVVESIEPGATVVGIPAAPARARPRDQRPRRLPRARSATSAMRWPRWIAAPPASPWPSTRDGRLAGVVTDGDLRRALLRGAGLEDPVAPVLTRRYRRRRPRRWPRGRARAHARPPHRCRPRRRRRRPSGRPPPAPAVPGAGRPHELGGHHGRRPGRAPAPADRQPAQADARRSPAGRSSSGSCSTSSGYGMQADLRGASTTWATSSRSTSATARDFGAPSRVSARGRGARHGRRARAAARSRRPSRSSCSTATSSPRRTWAACSTPTSPAATRRPSARAGTSTRSRSAASNATATG